ncbi:MAG: L,D-transpeptidase family protein [Steroidobacteraceae bacterium]
MNLIRPWLPGVAVALLAACSLNAPRIAPLPPPAPELPPPPPPAPVAPVVPQYPAPVATHRFEIDAESDDVVGVVQVTVVGKHDTLPDIARRFNVGYEEIVRANPGVDPWLPGAGREVVVPTQFVLPFAERKGIVVNIAAMRIYYFPPVKAGQKQVVYTHPIGIGKVGWSTPEGKTTVVSKQKDPVWRPTASIRAEHKKNGEILPAVVPAGPDNPLGRFKLTLGWPSYLIHGTNKPYGVGLRSSHGCLRLYPEDIAKLFEMAAIGTQVQVVNQPFVFGWHNNQLYLQAYGVLEDDKRDWSKAQPKLLAKTLTPRIRTELAASGEAVNWVRVAEITKDPRGLALSVSSDQDVTAVIAAAPRVKNLVPAGANWDGADDPALGTQNEVQEMVAEQQQAPRT